MERQRDFFDSLENTPEEPQDDPRQLQAHEAVSSYVDVEKLHTAVIDGVDLRIALRYAPELIPEDVMKIVDTLKLLLTPLTRQQIRSPHDLAAILMLEMGTLQQEEMRVACLDTKNRLQRIHMVYRGSLNTSLIRVGELYREPIRLNSAAVIMAHNHPSGDPTPSPEDVLVTREIVSAGRLLDIDCLDHIVISEGRWVSMRERGLGFN